MNLKSKIICVSLVLLFLFVVSCSSPRGIECTKIDSVNASITIKKSIQPIVGLNTDTDSLKFGTVSPKAVVERTMTVQYSNQAEALVMMEGDFAAWTEIDPSQFSLQPAEKKKVLFKVSVPEEVMEGNFTGKAVFCFRE